MSLTFRTVPIFVGDSTVKYFLFLVLLPTTFSETDLMVIVNLLQGLRATLSKQQAVDAIVSKWLDTLPFVQFNYLHFPQAHPVLRISEEGVSQLYIGETMLPLSVTEKDESYLCMALMKLYLS